MLEYNQTKINLAIAVCRNISKHIKEPVYVQCAGKKTVPSMKFTNLTVLQVFKHSELPLPSKTSIILKMFHKGKERQMS